MGQGAGVVVTDAWLMDAECIHGEVWHECKICEREMDLAMAEEEAEDD